MNLKWFITFGFILTTEFCAGTLYNVTQDGNFNSVLHFRMLCLFHCFLFMCIFFSSDIQDLDCKEYFTSQHYSFYYDTLFPVKNLTRAATHATDILNINIFVLTSNSAYIYLLPNETVQRESPAYEIGLLCVDH